MSCYYFIYRSSWGLGIGDWGLGIGDWGLGPIPNPQSPFFNILNNNYLKTQYMLLNIHAFR